MDKQFRMFNFNTDTDVNESEFEDLAVYQEITDVETVKELIGVPVVLDRHIHDFDSLMRRIVDIAALCWKIHDDEINDTLEHYMVPFKVDAEDEVVYTMPLNGFMFFLVFINPIIEYVRDIKITDFMFDCPLIEKERNRVISEIIKVMISFGKQMSEIYSCVADILLYMSELNKVFAQANIQVFTAENLFFDHYMDSELIREINNTTYSNDTQAAEIIEGNDRQYKKLYAEMLKRKNPLFIDNTFTSVIKQKQIEELYIHFGPIPDGRNIVPIIMNGNGFNDGYKDLSVLYAGAMAARVPDMMNEDYMGAAGYFARNLWILTYGTVSKRVYNCGSKNPIPIVIDELALRQFDGRFYYDNAYGGELKLFSQKDVHLVGKKLWFRSPCTCNLNHDVCHVCYGTKALRVKDLPGGFIYTTQLATGRINQNVLSAKHLLRAIAELVLLSDNFGKYFDIDSCQVSAREDKKFDIYIKEDYVDDISESFNVYIGKNLELVSISNYANIQVNDEIFRNGKLVTIDDVNYYKINSSKMYDDLCIITPINKMMTERYTRIMHLLENDISKYTNIEDVVTELYHLIDGIIPLFSTHMEIIVGRLIKRPDDDMRRPNWLEYEAPYKMVRVKTSLSNTESFTAALASEQTNHHLRHAIFDKRNEINRIGVRSFIDYMFGYGTL